MGREAGIGFTAGLAVPTGDFPGGPANFIEKVQMGLTFWNIQSLDSRKPVNFTDDLMDLQTW